MFFFFFLPWQMIKMVSNFICYRCCAFCLSLTLTLSSGKKTLRVNKLQGKKKKKCQKAENLKKFHAFWEFPYNLLFFCLVKFKETTTFCEQSTKMLIFKSFLLKCCFRSEWKFVFWEEFKKKWNLKKKSSLNLPITLYRWCRVRNC